jgi:hypothetical protein
MRGCRFKCGFCVVPKQEGKARFNQTIAQIWRGPGYPQAPSSARQRLLRKSRMARDGRVRSTKAGSRSASTKESTSACSTPNKPKAMASMRVMDDQFKTRRIYTAWDNIGDEAVFFRGVDLLEAEGVNPTT